MRVLDDPFEVLEVEKEARVAPAVNRVPVAAASGAAAFPAAVVARLYGFDGDDRPLVARVPGLPGEVVTARAAVPLLREHVGSPIVLLFEEADPHRPIVMGVLQEGRSAAAEATTRPPLVAVQADGDRFVLEAGREIVLRCGDASITLTRAGKVLIRGRYVLSRSSGYNRIKGAAVDIN